MALLDSPRSYHLTDAFTTETEEAAAKEEIQKLGTTKKLLDRAGALGVGRHG